MIIQPTIQKELVSLLIADPDLKHQYSAILWSLDLLLVCTEWNVRMRETGSEQFTEHFSLGLDTVDYHPFMKGKVYVFVCRSDIYYDIFAILYHIGMKYISVSHSLGNWPISLEETKTDEKWLICI